MSNIYYNDHKSDINKQDRYRDGGWNYDNISDKGLVEYGSPQEPLWPQGRK